MKNKFRLSLCIVFTLLLAACSKDKYPLNGLWTGNILDDEVYIAFIDDLCFVAFAEGRTNKANFTYKKDIVDITMNNITMPFTVQDNVMSIIIGEESFFLNKDTITETPEEIKGIWNGTDNTILAFVGNKVFISANTTADYATPRLYLDINMVTFQTQHSRNIYRLTIKGNTMNADLFTSGMVIEETFTR